ncbi:Xaa-Pro aminopeptidase, partial [Tremellales sp. Uapishka_1]
MSCLSFRRSKRLSEDYDGEPVYEKPPSPAAANVEEEEMQTRLRDLRREIADAKLDWYVVPSEDEHQSEFVGISELRRQYITNFSGSAGTALIPSSPSATALLFVDSRYYVLAERQIPKEGWEVRRVGGSGGPSAGDVVKGWVDFVVAEAEGRVGIDPKLISSGTSSPELPSRVFPSDHTIDTELANSIHSRLSSSKSSSKLVGLSTNLVDKIHSPTPRSLAPLLPHPLELSGESTASKLARLRESFSKQSQSWIYILPTLPAIAWLLNYRCPGDVPFVPVAYAYLVLTEDTCVLFVDNKKVEDEGLRARWEDEGVEVRDYGVEEVGKAVKEFADNLRVKNAKTDVKVWAPSECSWALERACEPAKIQIIPCPVDLAKGVKNKVELQGFRNAYLRDGRAMVRWMYWLEKMLVKDERRVGEWAAAQQLAGFRRREDRFAGLSYQDISASGPNGDGTIDTTRTLYLGKSPTEEMKRAYTRVLQGHLSVASSNFPASMDADRLVMLGHQYLYKDGLDFGHGLGHGVGSYLSVHECRSFEVGRPRLISPLAAPAFPRNASFQAGNVTSIEPGFYKEGEFGIRTESVYICKKVDTKYDFGGKKWLGWERVTQVSLPSPLAIWRHLTCNVVEVPIQTLLVEYSLLTKDEIRLLNDHNTSVQEALLPLLEEEEDKDVVKWLKDVCKPKKIWPWTGA